MFRSLALFGFFFLACSSNPETTTDAGVQTDTGVHDVTGLMDAASDSGLDTNLFLDTSVDSLAEVSDGPTEVFDTPTGYWRSRFYPADWEPSFETGDGHFIHDFSYAGYMRGEQPLPTTTELSSRFATFNVVTLGADPSGNTDSLTAFNSAIAQASVSGGIVYVPNGEYTLSQNLRVTASNVIMMGESQGGSKLRFTRITAGSDEYNLTFSGEGPNTTTSLPLVSDAVPRSHVLEVADAGALSSGQHVLIGQIISDAFAQEHGMDAYWMFSRNQWRTFFRREIVSIDRSVTPHRITVDVPIRYPVKTRDGASIQWDDRSISGCGVMNLSLTNALSNSEARAHNRSHVLAMQWVRDCWITNASSYDSHLSPTDKQLQSGGIIVLQSKRVTINSSTMGPSQHRGVGGNGYLFEIMQSSEILTQHSAANGGRHAFIQNWDFLTSGCVWYRNRSSGNRAVNTVLGIDFEINGANEFHHALALANLVDNCDFEEGFNAYNRTNESSGAGHSSTQNVFWNVRGGTINSKQYGTGYLVGVDQASTGLADLRATNTAPEDMNEGEGMGETLFPSSLYLDQKSRRIGP